MNKLGTPDLIWNSSAVLLAWPGREFRLWSDFGTEPNAYIIIMYFVSSLTEMCGSRKYPYPPQGWSLEIPKGRGILKAKIF